MTEESVRSVALDCDLARLSIFHCHFCFLVDLG